MLYGHQWLLRKEGNARKSQSQPLQSIHLQRSLATVRQAGRQRMSGAGDWECASLATCNLYSQRCAVRSCWYCQQRGQEAEAAERADRDGPPSSNTSGEACCARRPCRCHTIITFGRPTYLGMLMPQQLQRCQQGKPRMSSCCSQRTCRQLEHNQSGTSSHHCLH